MSKKETEHCNSGDDILPIIDDIFQAQEILKLYGSPDKQYRELRQILHELAPEKKTDPRSELDELIEMCEMLKEAQMSKDYSLVDSKITRFRKLALQKDLDELSNVINDQNANDEDKTVERIWERYQKKLEEKTSGRVSLTPGERIRQTLSNASSDLINRTELGVIEGRE